MRVAWRDGCSDAGLAGRLADVLEASVGLGGRVWVEDPGQSDCPGVRGGLIRAVTDRFETAGITIPYPRRTVDGTIEEVGASRPTGPSADVDD